MQRRPGFPAKLPVPGNAAAGKPVVAPPSVALRKPAVAPAPAGVGLDSSAVRARMVQKLAAGGITLPPVLQAMGAVERHRFVDSALVNPVSYTHLTLPTNREV